MKTWNLHHQTTGGQRVEAKRPLALAPLGKQECVKEAKTVKTGTEFIIRTGTMYVRAHRETVYLTEK